MLLVETAAAEIAPDCSGVDEAGFIVGSEAEALDLAAACDHPVEVDSLRSEAAKFTAETDGSITAEVYASPQWTTDDGGAWIDINPELVFGDEGLVEAAAVPGSLVVSSGGDAQPLASLTTESGETLDLWWPEALPAPVLGGPQARYAEVIAGVDLVVETGATGFAYRLEVKTADAAQDPALQQIEVVLGGTLEVTQDSSSGALTATDPSTGEAVLTASNALMWDASVPASADVPAAGPTQSFAESLAQSDTGSDADPGDPGRVEHMALALDGDALTITPDAAMLADPETVFPVVLDPSFESTNWAWATVGSDAYADTTWWDDAAWPRSGGLRMGFNGWAAPGEEGYGVWRSMIRFDLRSLEYAAVNSAVMSLDIKHTGGCNSYPLELWQTNIVTKGTTPTSWNSTAGNWLHGAPLDMQTVQSANGSGGCSEAYPVRSVAFDSDDLTYHVNRHANEPYQSITLGLRASDEANREQWFRADVATAHLTISYVPTMAVPSDLTMDGINCLAPEGARVTGSQPTLSAVPHFSDAASTAGFEVRDASGATVAQHVSASPAVSGQAYSWQVETPLPDGTYEVRARTTTSDQATNRYTTWCSFGVDSTLDAIEEVSVTTLTCPFDITGLDPAVDTLEAETEGGALLLAEACGMGVVVTGLQDYSTRVVANPEGTLTAEAGAVPAWAPDAEGAWTEVDTTFTETADGAITTTAAVSDIAVSSGGTDPFVTATSPEGGSIALSWPTELPAPVIDGDTATFAEVLSGVDLQVSSSADGFTYALVVKTAEAAQNPELASIELGIESEGLTVAQDAATGEITATDTAGEVVFSAPAAYMWDASVVPDPAAEAPVAESFAAAEEEVPDTVLGEDDTMPGLYAPVEVDLSSTTLTVIPDAALLASEDAQFPITIDPPFVGKRQAWANIFESRPSSSWTNDKDWPRSGGMRVGLNWWSSCAPDACGLWRSVVRFGIGDLEDRDILTAKVAMTQTHTGSCGSTSMELWEVNRKLSNGTHWNSITSSDPKPEHLQTKSVASSNTTGCATDYPDRDVNFDGSDIKTELQENVTAGRDWMSFMVRASDEGDPYSWRRIDIKSVELQVTYNRAATVPTSLQTNRQSCVTSGWTAASWTSEVQPLLSGVPHDADGKTGAKFEVRRNGSNANILTWATSRNQTDNIRIPWTVPKQYALGTGEYRWRMASLDDYKNGTDSAFSSWCYFRVDTTAPTPPKVELISPADPQAGDTVTFKLTATDTHSGLASFAYGVGTEALGAPVTATGGTATIEVTAPAEGGRVWLWVKAFDTAGNASQFTQADFYAPLNSGLQPVAAWRLDGDGFDDVSAVDLNGGAANLDLGLGRTSGWVDSDGQAPPGQAMLFGGADCVSTAGPAVNTSAQYTVAAWVRLDQADTNIRTIFSQSGAKGTGFALRYRGTSAEWDLMLTHADDGNGNNVTRAASTTDPVVGEWTHLAVTVDPGAKVIQLWANGVLEATRSFTHEAWNATGPINIGCSGSTSPYKQSGYFIGAVQHVAIWTGLITGDQVQTVMAGDLPAGLAGEWLLRENGIDTSMQANHMTVPETGATWVEDQWGRTASAADLDGAACVTAGDSVASLSEGSFSIGAWVKPDAVNATSEQTVVAEHGGEYYKFKLRMWTDGKWGLSLGTGPTGTGAQNVTATTTATLNEWTHLLAVYDAASSTASLYINGVLDATRTLTFEPWQGTGKLNIGCRGTQSGVAGGGLFNGTISRVQLWRGALTAEEATGVYGGNPAVEREGNWTLDYRSLADLQQGHDLTVTGALNTDYKWGRSASNRGNSALEFLGAAGWAQTAGPVVATDASFTIATRVYVNADADAPEYQTILSQGGQEKVGFNLNYQTDQTTWEGRFQFAMPSADTATSVTWHSLQSSQVIETGKWYHVAVVVNIPAKTMTMYVDGVASATGTGTATPWDAAGPLYLGVYGRLNGNLVQPFNGRIDSVQAWTSTLDPDRIGDLSRTTG
ncbi:LamG domain-containing protein [Glycomyces harbinensis]|uniref:Concanavalin A-like lectin/glucanases superfamily protein n=1 Tax=Glycomyces harbinensis TaxID=58114 RepID=A0A1G6SG46_9ACTN|nr:LamG domain-containing protein [Glycomyces harbinensis]SDD15872.1 Concanavalin A-like lectin/glucanases superfamily protein [Glycomyces harbinensis]